MLLDSPALEHCPETNAQISAAKEVLSPAYAMKGPSIDMARIAPIRTARKPSVCLQCAHRLSRPQRSPFSSSSGRKATLGQESHQSGSVGRMQRMNKSQTQKSAMKNIKASQIGSDFGLIGNGKIPPTMLQSLPLATKAPRKLLKLCWLRTKLSVLGLTR